MSKLADKLQRLLALATLKEGEDRNDGRVNEARTASFLLLKTCQDNGVRISFKLPPEKREPGPAFDPDATHGPGTVNFEDFFTAFFRSQQAAETKRTRDAFKRPGRHVVSEVFVNGQRISVKDINYQAPHHGAGGWGCGVMGPNKGVQCIECKKPIDCAESYLVLTDAGIRRYFHAQCSRIGRAAVGW